MSRPAEPSFLSSSRYDFTRASRRTWPFFSSQNLSGRPAGRAARCPPQQGIPSRRRSACPPRRLPASSRSTSPSVNVVKETCAIGAAIDRSRPPQSGRGRSNQLSLALEVAKLRIGCPRAERPFEREASQMLKDAVSISRVEASGEGDHDVALPSASCSSRCPGASNHCQPEDISVMSIGLSGTDDGGPGDRRRPSHSIVRRERVERPRAHRGSACRIAPTCNLRVWAGDPS